MSDQPKEHGFDEESERDLPRIVEEAQQILTAHHLKTGGTAILAVAAWVLASFSGAYVPPALLLLVLGVLAVLAFFPVTREPRLAQDVIRRWDTLRVERALASSGVSPDPRLEVAESMAERIARHPASDEHIRAVVDALVRRLRRLLDDLGRTTYLTHAQVASDHQEASRSMSDLQDLLDAKVAELLGELARLHRTVVMRDTASLDRVVRAAEDLMRDLEAEREVERLLSRAERE